MRSCRPRLKLIAALLLPALLWGCDFPADPDGTTERVRNGEIRVGVIAGHPELSEEEQVLQTLARSLNARISSREGDAHRLFDDIEQGRLDLVYGALPMETPFAEKVALSKAIATTAIGGEQVDTAFAIKRGENRLLLEVNRAIAEAGS